MTDPNDTRKQTMIHTPPLRRVFKWLATIFVFGAFSLYVAVNRADFQHVLEIDPYDIALLIGLVVIYTFLMGYQLYLLIKVFAGEITYWTCFEYVSVGGFLNFFFPQSSFFYRAASFKFRNNLSVKKYLGVYLIFNWETILVSALIGTGIILFYDPSLCIGGIRMTFLMGGIALGGLVFLPMLHAFRQSALIQRMTFLAPVTAIVEHALEYLRFPMVLIKTAIVVGIHTVLNLFLMALCFKSIGLATDLPALMIFLITTRLANLIAITPGNFGIREFAFGYLANALGTSVAMGMSVSLILRVVDFSTKALLSLVCLIFLKRRRPAGPAA